MWLNDKKEIKLHHTQCNFNNIQKQAHILPFFFLLIFLRFLFTPSSYPDNSLSLTNHSSKNHTDSNFLHFTKCVCDVGAEKKLSMRGSETALRTL